MGLECFSIAHQGTVKKVFVRSEIFVGSHNILLKIIPIQHEFVRLPHLGQLLSANQNMFLMSITVTAEYFGSIITLQISVQIIKPVSNRRDLSFDNIEADVWMNLCFSVQVKEVLDYLKMI